MKFAITECNGYFDIFDISDKNIENRLVENIKKKNQVSIFKQGIWEIFYGTWEEVCSRVRKIENEFFKVL